MFEFQNQDKIAKSLKDRGYNEAQDNEQILIKPKSSSIQKGKLGEPMQPKHMQTVQEEEKERDLTDFERDCLARFDQNDAEIDQMLDLVIG